MTADHTESARRPTPGQTIGPFFGYGLPYPGDRELVPPGRADAVRLHGLVRDGASQPIPDALIEIWQADSQGSVVQQQGSLHRDGWTFTGWGRSSTDGTGHYSFSTITPGAAPGRAAFFAVTVFARGVTHRLLTRAYLPQDAAVLAADPLLSALGETERQTLLTTADEHGYVFDIWLQGERETVFLSHLGLNG